jgi:hypothetical protein
MTDPNGISEAGYEMWAELLAAQLAISALVKSHPNRAALIAHFDAAVTGMQMHSAQRPDAEMTPDALRKSLARVRKTMSE